MFFDKCTISKMRRIRTLEFDFSNNNQFCFYKLISGERYEESSQF